MSRYAGDYQGECRACGEYVEFGIGVRPDQEPVAMRFGPGGPAAVAVRQIELVTMMDDELDLKFEYVCPLCEQWSAGRTTCRARD